MAKKLKKSQETSSFEFDINDYRLNTTDKKVLELHLENPELKQIEIAKLLNRSQETISKVFNKPVFKKAKLDFSKEALQIIKETKNKAARTLRELLDSENEAIKARVATDILKYELDNMGKEDGEEDNDLTFEGWN